jgi:aldehyde dehydrogenase (NAD+)
VELAPAARVGKARSCAACRVLCDHQAGAETAADGQVLAAILAGSNLPEGVVSVLPADREVSEYLVSHPGIDKIAFTGSTATGCRIAAIAAQRITRVSLELGGKSAAIFLPDADLSQFANSLVRTSMSNCGQVRTSHTRVLAPAANYDDVVPAAVEAIAGCPRVMCRIASSRLPRSRAPPRARRRRFR